MTLQDGVPMRTMLPLLLSLVWLLPFSPGPTPAVAGWLMAFLGVGFVVLFRAKISESGVVDGWILAAVASAIFGILQYFGQTLALSPWVHATGLGEAYANLRQRNQFATLTSIGLLALLWQVSGAWAEQAVALRSAALWAVLLGLGNAASGSRTGLLQWATILAVYSVVWTVGERKRALAVVTIAMLAYAGGSVALPWLLDASTGIHSDGLLGRFKEESGCASRTVLWSNVLHLIAQRPWIGWDWGELDYAHFITLYPGERFCEILDNAHNLPLHLAVELGIPVAAAFCGACAWLVWRNKPWAETDPTRQLAWGVLAVIGLHSMLEYPLWYGPFQLAVVLCIWLLWRSPEAYAKPVQGPLPVRAATGVAAVILLALCTYVAWDYWRISQIYLPPSARHAAYRDDTLAKIQGSWLFRDHVRFAELTTTPLDEDNAAHIHALGKAMLHFSPEPRVVEKVIESAVMLGQDDEALFYLQRYKAAFPVQHARWSAALKVPK